MAPVDDCPHDRRDEAALLYSPGPRTRPRAVPQKETGRCSREARRSSR